MGNRGSITGVRHASRSFYHHPVITTLPSRLGLINVDRTLCAGRDFPCNGSLAAVQTGTIIRGQGIRRAKEIDVCGVRGRDEAGVTGEPNLLRARR